MNYYSTWYHNTYLQSYYWRAVRWLKFKLSGRRCAKCGATKRLEIHHRFYRLFGYSILGWEWIMMWALQVLCRDCHEKEAG